MEDLNKEVEVSNSSNGEAPVQTNEIKTEESIMQDTTASKVEETVETVENGEEKTKVEKKLYTDEQQAKINTLLKEQKEKTLNNLLKNYGFEKQEDLDNAIGKVQSYDTMKDEYSKTHDENLILKQDLALIKCKISEDNYEIVKTYFKGLGKELNAESLQSVLKENPTLINQWVKQTDKSSQIILGNAKQEEKKGDGYEEFKKKIGLKY